MSRQAGFTTIELMIALVIGLITTLAAFQALDRFGVVTASVSARTDNTQRGRGEMDGLIRALRSQVCTGPGATGTSLLVASPTQVTFAADLGDGSTPPEQRTITYTAATRRLDEARVKGTTDAAGVTTFGGAPIAGQRLGDVDPETTGAPVFTYFAFDSAVPPRPVVQLTGNPLSATDRGKVAKIAVAFRVGPSDGQRDRGTGASLKDEIMLRSVDPADPVPVPRCF